MGNKKVLFLSYLLLVSVVVSCNTGVLETSKPSQSSAASSVEGSSNEYSKSHHQPASPQGEVTSLKDSMSSSDLPEVGIPERVNPNRRQISTSWGDARHMGIVTYILGKKVMAFGNRFSDSILPEKALVLGNDALAVGGNEYFQCFLKENGILNCTGFGVGEGGRNFSLTAEWLSQVKNGQVVMKSISLAQSEGSIVDFVVMGPFLFLLSDKGKLYLFDRFDLFSSYKFGSGMASRGVVLKVVKENMDKYGPGAPLRPPVEIFTGLESSQFIKRIYGANDGEFLALLTANGRLYLKSVSGRAVFLYESHYKYPMTAEESQRYTPKVIFTIPTTPILVNGDIGFIKDVSVQRTSLSALTLEGSVFVLGTNSWGRLGLGAFKEFPWTDFGDCLSVTRSSFCRKPGEQWQRWPGRAPLGEPVTVDAPKFTKISNLSSVAMVLNSNYLHFAIRTDGQLWTAGGPHSGYEEFRDRPNFSPFAQNVLAVDFIPKGFIFMQPSSQDGKVDFYATGWWYSWLVPNGNTYKYFLDSRTPVPILLNAK